VSHDRNGSVRTPTLGARCPKSGAAISAQSPKRSSQPKRHGGCQAAAPPTPPPPPSVLVLAPAPARSIRAVVPAHQRLLRFPHGRANAAPKPLAVARWSGRAAVVATRGSGAALPVRSLSIAAESIVLRECHSAPKEVEFSSPRVCQGVQWYLARHCGDSVRRECTSECSTE
jgi:hypothetical protein